MCSRKTGWSPQRRPGTAPRSRALLERYQERVFGFGLRMCGDSEDAEDVHQDTLLAAARTVGKFRGESSVSTWLYTIARSFCIIEATSEQNRKFPGPSWAW